MSALPLGRTVSVKLRRPCARLVVPAVRNVAPPAGRQTASRRAASRKGCFWAKTAEPAGSVPAGAPPGWRMGPILSLMDDARTLRLGKPRGPRDTLRVTGVFQK